MKSDKTKGSHSRLVYFGNLDVTNPHEESHDSEPQPTERQDADLSYSKGD